MRYLRLAYAPLAAVTLLATASPALAQFGSSISVTPGGSTSGGGAKKFSDIINQGFIVFTWIAGIAAIFFLLLSGFQYITAGGDGEKAGKARAGIINAIIGIIILMAAFFIFNAARNAGGGLADGNVNSNL
jgi:hypothetical protein